MKKQKQTVPYLKGLISGHAALSGTVMQPLFKSNKDALHSLNEVLFVSIALINQVKLDKMCEKSSAKTDGY